MNSNYVYEKIPIGLKSQMFFVFLVCLFAVIGLTIFQSSLLGQTDVAGWSQLKNAIDGGETEINLISSFNADDEPITVTKDTFAADALRIMNTHKIGVLIVADRKGTPEGIFHLHDLLRSGAA